MSYPLILDGAMGTELQIRGVEIPLPLWSADANIDHPEIIQVFIRIILLQVQILLQLTHLEQQNGHTIRQV